MNDVVLAIIGFGPYARNVHLPQSLNWGVTPKLIVDLEGSDLADTKATLPQTEFFYMPRTHRTGFEASDAKTKALVKRIVELKITHVILSAEPLAHYDYLQMLHPLNVAILCDKPVLAVKDIDHQSAAVALLQQRHQDLLALYSRPNSPQLHINLDYRYWNTHQAILQNAAEYAQKNRALPDLLSIYYSGGNWYMPQEFTTRDGHPFKDGYGVLFHTSFHFVDFVAQYLQKITQGTDDQVKTLEVFCISESPKQALARMGTRTGLDEASSKYQHLDLSKTGALNTHYLIRVKTTQGLSTTISLELMTCGVSARTNPALPKDNYTGSGRHRTETIRLSVSPDLFLMYQDIRGSQGRKAVTTKSERVGNEVQLSVRDHSIEDAKPKGSVMVKFFMGANVKDTQVTELKTSLRLFEILIDANRGAQENGGTFLKSYSLSPNT